MRSLTNQEFQFLYWFYCDKLLWNDGLFFQLDEATYDQVFSPLGKALYDYEEKMSSLQEDPRVRGQAS